VSVEQHDAPAVIMSDADRALTRVRQQLSALPIEVRVSDVCYRCGQHTIADEATRLQFFATGGSTTCGHCGISKTCKPALVAGEGAR